MGAAGTAAPECRASTSLKTSSRVMRPPGPVPVTSERSIPFSESSRRTMGEVTTRSAPSSCASPTGVAAGWGAAGRRGRCGRWRRRRRRVPASRGGGCRSRGGGCRSRGGGCLRGRSGGGRAVRSTVADHGQLHAHLDRLAFRHEDLGDHACGGRWHLGVDLVRRDLEERLVALDRVADALHPARHRSLGDRLAQLRHHHVSQRGVPFRSAPASSRRRSPRAKDEAG